MLITHRQSPLVLGEFEVQGETPTTTVHLDPRPVRLDDPIDIGAVIGIEPKVAPLHDQQSTTSGLLEAFEPT